MAVPLIVHLDRQGPEGSVTRAADISFGRAAGVLGVLHRLGGRQVHTWQGLHGGAGGNWGRRGPSVRAVSFHRAMGILPVCVWLDTVSDFAGQACSVWNRRH